MLRGRGGVALVLLAMDRRSERLASKSDGDEADRGEAAECLISSMRTPSTRLVTKGSEYYGRKMLCGKGKCLLVADQVCIPVGGLLLTGRARDAFARNGIIPVCGLHAAKVKKWDSDYGCEMCMVGADPAESNGVGDRRMAVDGKTRLD